MNTRPEDWPTRLYDFLEEVREQPFAWGSRDCALTACDWIKALTGIDPAADLRGTYSTALGAARVMKERGGLEQIARDACAMHRWPEVRPAFARRGDITLYDTDSGPALGVCDGAKSVFIHYKSGVVLIRTMDCRIAWRVA